MARNDWGGTIYHGLPADLRRGGDLPEGLGEILVDVRAVAGEAETRALFAEINRAEHKAASGNRRGTRPELFQ